MMLNFSIFSVCPANWDPEKNSATIKPNPTESQEYFNKQA